jgi:metallo-beta-lactamase class B
MINGHAHIDHAGAFAYLKQQVPGAELVVMREDVPAMGSGDKGHFKYAEDLVYPGVKVDRVLRDGDTIELGDVLLNAYLPPGHTRGSTTWVANIVDMAALVHPWFYALACFELAEGDLLGRPGSLFG